MIGVVAVGIAVVVTIALMVVYSLDDREQEAREVDELRRDLYMANLKARALEMIEPCEAEMRPIQILGSSEIRYLPAPVERLSPPQPAQVLLLPASKSSQPIPVDRPYRKMRHRDSGPEFVYLIQDVDVTSYCKIGRTKNPERRLSTFEVKLPFKFEILAIIETANARGLETSLHRRYADRRVSGEWFALTPDDIDAIKHDYPS
jgi:hypothetical protein